MRNFVLVTATATSRAATTEGTGIKKLKRGVALEQFVCQYLTGITELAECELLERAGAWTAIRRTTESVFTWTFTAYPEDELFTAVAHLTKDELLRDLKELLPLKGSR